MFHYAYSNSMISIKPSKVLEGHSKYGDPPVVIFSVVFTGTEASWAAAQQRVRSFRDQINPRLHASVEIETIGAIPSLAKTLTEVLLTLLQLAMHPSGRAILEPQAEENSVNVVVPCEESQTCIYAGEVTAGLFNKALAESIDRNFMQDDVGDFLLFAKERLVDENTHLLRLAARKRGLPVIDLELDQSAASPPGCDARHGLIQVGQGIHQRRILGGVPDRQSLQLMSFKDHRRLIPRLAASGIPLPRQDLEFANRNRLSRALRSAKRLGFPVTMKSALRPDLSCQFPAIGEFGPLYSPDQLALAFDAAAGNAHAVWVEEYLPGDSYRFLIVGGHVSAVARRQPPMLIGDGVSTLRNLASAHADKAVTLVKYNAWKDILDRDADLDVRLRLADLTWDTIVPAGQQVALRAHGTPYNGGVCEDVTDRMPEIFKRIAEQAAASCGMSLLAGVDMIIRSVQDEAKYPNCTVTEVMPDPDLLTHCQPDTGIARNVSAELLDALFPDGRSGRVPVVAVTGTNGKTTTSRMIAHILRHIGRHVGLCTTMGAQVNDEMLFAGDLAGVPGAAFVLCDPRTEAAVLETARGGLIKLGTPFDCCDVGVCLNVESDHIGVDGVESLDEMAVVKSEVVKRSKGAVVLNADDKRVLSMAAVSRASRIILVSAEAGSDAVYEHLARGGEAVTIEGEPGAERLVWHEGEKETPLLSVAAIPATYGGAVRFNTVNAAFAAAATLGMEVASNKVAEALSCFTASFEANPGRFNVFDGLPFEVIFDYAHNAHGLRALAEAIKEWPVSGRRILVSRGPADRSSADIREMASAVAGRFDVYICTNYLDLRGHEPTEVPEIFRSLFLDAGSKESAVLAIPDSVVAVETALGLARPGDLLVIMAGKDIQKLWSQIKNYSAGAPEGVPFRRDMNVE